MPGRPLCLCQHKVHGSGTCGSLADGDDNRCEWCRRFH